MRFWTFLVVYLYLFESAAFKFIQMKFHYASAADFWSRGHPDTHNMTVTLSENLYCPSLHLYLINVSTDVDESLRRKKEGKKKLYAGCKQIELCLKEENAAGGMSTKCPVRKRQRFSAAGCAISIIHLLLLEIELLCLTGCALNGSILITLGIINIGLSCCAAKCVIVSVLAIILIMDSSSLKPASLTQDSDQLFFFLPPLAFCCCYSAKALIIPSCPYLPCERKLWRRLYSSKLVSHSKGCKSGQMAKPCKIKKNKWWEGKCSLCQIPLQHV